MSLKATTATEFNNKDWDHKIKTVNWMKWHECENPIWSKYQVNKQNKKQRDR